MKMLFLTDNFPPSEGGSRVYYYHLCANYNREKVVVLTKKINGYKEFDKNQQIKIIRKGHPLPNWKIYQLPRFLSPLLWTIYLIFKERIDVIHCGDFLPAGAIGLILKKLLGIPYVYYVHGEGNTWFQQFRFQPKFRKIVLRNAERIVAACTYAEEGVKRDLNGGYEKVFKITPGVDYKKFNPKWKDTELLRELGLEGKKVILTVGRLVERKGQDSVISAMPKILADVPDAVYLVGGRGPYEERLRSLAAELNLENHVTFLGFVPQGKLFNLYSICDVFVMINRETIQDGPEGFGMVFTEASAAGKPVVAGKSGGTEDSVLDGITGYRVDPMNVDEIGSHIIKILKDEQLRKTLGRNGREWVERTFDWREKSRELEKLNMSIFESKKK
jgi:phosphatidylinositol alpha-1,6-mannosyltransferase